MKKKKQTQKMHKSKKEKKELALTLINESMYQYFFS